MFKLGLATAVDILGNYDLLYDLPPINLGRGPGVSGTARIVVGEGIISHTEQLVCRVVSFTTPVHDKRLRGVGWEGIGHPRIFVSVCPTKNAFEVESPSLYTYRLVFWLSLMVIFLLC